ncbi:MAG: 3'-5' exonuclease [Vibrio splendidus]
MIVSVLDTESTGLDVQEEKIIELALSVYRLEDDLSYKQIGATWNPLIWTPKRIDSKAQAVHGISAADLEGKPSFADISPKLVQLLEKSDLVVAHNGEGFDFPILAFNLMAEDIVVPDFKFFDTMLRGRTTTALGKVPNLGELCWAMGVDYDPDKAHRADYDTEVLAEAFFKGLKLGYFSI